jgi:hypothetical protein
MFLGSSPRAAAPPREYFFSDAALDLQIDPRSAFSAVSTVNFFAGKGRLTAEVAEIAE